MPPPAGTCEPYTQYVRNRTVFGSTRRSETDRHVRTSARATEVGRRLMEVPGVGPVLASAIVAAVPDPRAFKFGRPLVAWIPPCAATELQRRQGTARWHHQARRSIPAAIARCRRARGRPLCSTAWTKATLVGRAACPSHDEDRCGCARQQDGADDLGHHDARRTLQGAAGLASIVASGERSGLEFGRGSDAM